jgi:glycosyltransferase involved in cell wall biosynthesis
MKQQEDLVSVIVPTYCEEENIERCLKSIRAQKPGIETEVIVVDSNSPDNTRTIARYYADIVLNLRERGVSKARNAGARKAKGELLLFLDADTILDDCFLAQIQECFRDQKIVCISGFVEGLERLGIIDNLFKLFHYSLLNKISAFTAKIGFPFFPTVCCACRKSAFNKIGGFDENLAIAEDIAFSLKMGKIGRCSVIKTAKAYTSLRRVEKNGRMKNYLTYFRNYYRVFIRNEKPWIRDFPHTCEI